MAALLNPQSRAANVIASASAPPTSAASKVDEDEAWAPPPPPPPDARDRRDHSWTDFTSAVSSESEYVIE